MRQTVFLAFSVFCLAVASLALAAKPDERVRVEIVADQTTGAVRFIVDGTEQARIDQTGLHVRESISYGRELQDYGAKGFEAHLARGGGNREQ